MLVNGHFTDTKTSDRSTPLITERSNNPSDISHALQRTAKTDNAKCLVVGYSPTGGGHTGRTLSIIKMALEKNKLPHGSSVIFHVPPAWPDANSEKSAFSKPLSDLCRLLSANKVNVILSQSDKPIYGYLTQDGGSDDTNILRRLASYPQRAVSNKTIFDAKLFIPNNHESYYHLLPTITAKNLFSSLTGENSTPAIAKEKIFVLTDMAPDLQKAAEKFCIATTHRVDQQNHAIMLKPDAEHDLNPKNAILAKVLGGTGEQISHIGLGEKNTLGELGKSLNKLNISPTDSLDKVRKTIYRIALCHSKTPNEINKISGFSGVITGNKSQSPQLIKSMTYIYAHKKNDAIIRFIIDGMSQDRPEFKDRLFVVCGENAIPNHNALHLSYIADADGITTAGAGTAGESLYLHTKGSSSSHLLVLPIEEHNEQEANALYLKNHPTMGKYTSLGLNQPLTELLDAFFKRPLSKNSKTMQTLFSVTQDQDTYLKQACDTLFGEMAPSEHSQQYALREQKMRRSRVLTAHRRLFKLVAQIEDNIATGKDKKIKLTTNHTAISQSEALGTLMDTHALALFLGTNKNVVESFPMLEKVRAAFKDNINAKEREKITSKLYQSPYTGF